MISEKSTQFKFNLFATPPSKNMISPKSIARKPSMVTFTKKKPTEIAQIRSSDRIRFISPTKANLFINEDMLDPQNSLEFNYTQYSANQKINYPFIKRCASPKHFDHVSISRRTSFGNQVLKQDTSFLSTFLEPSIQDFTNCQFANSPINNSRLLSQQISNLKKTNFQLNLLLDEKNELVQKQKLDYDSKLAELTQQLMEIKNAIQNSQSIITQSQQKMLIYQSKAKQLQTKLYETNQKLQKTEKQVKMYKAKYRINFNAPKEKQDLKTKKYHQNCCKGNQNHLKGLKNHDLNCNSKPNTLKQSKKTNMIEATSLKKIKSETILPACKMTSLQASPQASRLMKIHSNEEQFTEYISLKTQIENLAKQIRYKDIEILTLKKIKCEYEKQQQNFQKVKKFNKKLLARVQFLTNQSDNTSKKGRLSLPLQFTPKKKFQVQYQDFDEEQSEQEVSQIVEFQLSPQKHFSQAHTFDSDMVFGVQEFE